MNRARQAVSPARRTAFGGRAGARRVAAWALVATLLAGWGRLTGAEWAPDLGSYPSNQTPPGFRSTVTGSGGPGEWRIQFEELTPAVTNDLLRPSVTERRAVLAQLSRDPTDERFPLLIYAGERFGDFHFTVRLRTIEGQAEQMAGIAFRIQNETNYYVLRVSSLGNTVRFYKIVDGVRSPPLGQDIAIPRGRWHELGVECKGNRIRCWFEGRLLLPDLTDDTFAEGYVGFWTKSDSVSQFAEPRMVYQPRESLAKRLVQRTLAEHPRLLGVVVYATPPGKSACEVVASTDPDAVGRPATANETEASRGGTPFYNKEADQVSVLAPLRDRNGDPVAAVRLLLRKVPGQTQDNAWARARPIIREMQELILAADDLFQ